jgi:hypothetical protein
MGNGNLEFAPTVEIEVTFMDSENNVSNYLFYDDFNNDGAKELITINKYNDISISTFTNSTVLRVFAFNAQINNFELIHENTFPGFTFRPTKSKVNFTNTFIDFVGFGSIYTTQTTNRLLFLSNNGDFSFDFSAQDISNGDFTLADFNEDHLQDIVINTGPAFEDLMTIYLQGPNHTFTQFTSFGPFIYSISEIACQDVDLDGDIDILVGSENKPKFFYFENSGDNINFSRVAIDTTFGSFRKILLDDFDQDGDEDAVCSGLTDDGRITYYESLLAKPLQLSQEIELKNHGIKIYPNPTTDWLRIDLETAGSAYTAQLLDATGRLVQQESFTSIGAHNLSISSLATGIYYCRVLKGDDIVVTEKVVKMN